MKIGDAFQGINKVFLDTAPVSQKAALIRVRYGLKLPDALQVATALVAGCDAFLTNDVVLQRVTELRILVLSALEI
jgi:predicted nucleic acid-binding protein